MSVVQAVRYKPDVNQSSLETTVAALDPATAPPTGTVVMTAQVISYDDAKYVPGADPGDPATEKFVTILYHEPISLPLESFVGLSQADSQAKWTAELTAFGDRMKQNNTAQLLNRAIRPARKAAPIVIA